MNLPVQHWDESKKSPNLHLHSVDKPPESPQVANPRELSASGSDFRCSHQWKAASFSEPKKKFFRQFFRSDPGPNGGTTATNGNVGWGQGKGPLEKIHLVKWLLSWNLGHRSQQSIKSVRKMVRFRETKKHTWKFQPLRFVNVHQLEIPLKKTAIQLPKKDGTNSSTPQLFANKKSLTIH